MIKLNLFEYYKQMNENKIVFAYKGTISQDVLVELAELIKDKLFSGSKQRNKIKKVFAIFIELAQNILHHSAEKVSIKGTDKKIGTGIIVVSETSDYYTITSGNLAERENLLDVIKRCDFINSLNAVKLKEYYKEQRSLPFKKGASGPGLGLIDIARKSKNPLEYDFNPVDNSYSFLILSVQVRKVS